MGTDFQTANVWA